MMEPTQEPQETPETEVSSSSEERNWCMACHLASLAGLVGVGFGHVLGPLIVWLIKKDEYPSVDAHGKAALNFQISMTIYLIIAFALTFIAIGFILLPILAIFGLIQVILASVKASKGDFHDYKFVIEFLK